MARNYLKNYFYPKNPDKYKGKGSIIYRSGWELKVMQFLDEHPHVIAWQSEGMEIKYFNPIKRKHTVYIPDFIVVFIDPTDPSKRKAEMWEVKPLKETAYQNPKTGQWIPYTPISERTKKPLKVSQATRMVQAVNAAKWAAAQAYCKMAGMTLRILTEENLFNDKSRR